MYTHKYTTDYLFTKENLTTSFVRIANYIQETSLNHSNYTGYPIKWFYQNKKGFLLTSWNFEIINLPKWGEEISISTWPSKIKGKVANRSFLVKNENAQCLVKADSKWAYVDMETEEPLKIPEKIIEDFMPFKESLIENPIKIPKIEDSLKEIFQSQHIVKRFDIDSNHHVNNINYIMWALNDIPEYIYNNKALIKASVKYTKESKINEPLVINTYLVSENQYLTIIKNEKSNEIKSQIFTIWQ